MSFRADNNGQNSPDMLVLQFHPGESDLKIVYPTTVPGSTGFRFPTPAWGKRRCIALGGGHAPGEIVAPEERPLEECSGKGVCELDESNDEAYEVYVCACDTGYSGDNCETHHKAALIISMISLVLIGVVVAKWYLVWRRKQAAEVRVHQMESRLNELSKNDNKLIDMHKQLEEDQRKLKEKEQLFQEQLEERARLQGLPPEWDQKRQEILVEVPPDDKQYWDVMDELKATLEDGWLSCVWRIQNRPLYNYYCFQRSRLESTNGAPSPEKRVWHGTSDLDPAVIYNDKQDVSNIAPPSLPAAAAHFELACCAVARATNPSLHAGAGLHDAVLQTGPLGKGDLLCGKGCVLSKLLLRTKPKHS
eukprot:COSAG06_NODE_3894_length_4796_cov_13.479881_2_plen_362_part_00